MTDMLAWLFEPERDAVAPRATRLTLAAIYVAGAIGWAYVLGWGAANLNFHDWSGINLPRLQFLQNALRDGTLPMHMSGGMALHYATDRFLSLPDVITTPQVLLLLVMPVQTFVVVDVLIQYSIGFLGLLMLRRHFGWSLFTFALVFPLVIFNGHILAHYSVGHFTWGAYFVFPWIALFVFRYLDGDHGWTLLAKFAVAVFYMVLAGGQHHVTWVLLLLVLLMPFCRRRAWWLLSAAVAGVMLSAVRLLPPALELSSFRAQGFLSDAIGFPSLSHLLTALTVLRREAAWFHPALPGNLWFFDSYYYEFSAFIGVAGLGVVAAGVYAWLRSGSPRYPELIVPIIGLLIMSMGSVYRLVRLLPIPLLESERYPGRLFSVPLVLLIVVAAMSLDPLLRRATARWTRALALALLALVALDITAAMRLWRVTVSFGLMRSDSPFDAVSAAVIERPDPAYTAVTLIGLAITVTTALALWVLARRQRWSSVRG
jgi:hypothetical protein